MPTVIGPSGKGCCSQSSSEPSNRLGGRSSPNSCSSRSPVACRWLRTLSEFSASRTGNSSLSKSTTRANGINDAQRVSRYSISGVVRPWSQALMGRNVHGPSVWQEHRFQRGFGTCTGPNTVFTGVAGILAGVPLSALRTRPVLVQILAHLLCDDEILHSRQQGFALLQCQSQGF